MTKWSNLLPWNWIKCCISGSELEPEPMVDPTGGRAEYQKLSMDEARSMIGSHIPDTDNEHAITEPVTDIISDISVDKNKMQKVYRVYLLHNDQFEFKRDVTQTFGKYATVKDFLSGMYGQRVARDYDCYAGTSKSWVLLSFTGIFVENRIFKMVHRETGETYVVLTNKAYCKRSQLVTPSTRLDEMARRLVDRSDLSKPYNPNFNPVPANSVLPGY